MSTAKKCLYCDHPATECVALDAYDSDWLCAEHAAAQRSLGKPRFPQRSQFDSQPIPPCRCGQPATHYTQERLEVRPIVGRTYYTPYLKTAWCAQCAPPDAKPIVSLEADSPIIIE